jgi:transposase InsO family protein
MTPERRAFLAEHLRSLHGDDEVERILGVFDSEAARLPRSTPFSSSGMYPSFKNRSAILRESRTGELPYYRLLEHDPDVIAYAHQPALPVHVSWTTTDGAVRNATLTADTIVLRHRRTALVEVKPEDAIVTLANARPGFVVRDVENGRWRCPSAEAYLARFGLTYEIVTPAEFPKTMVRNLEGLGAAFRAQLPEPSTVMAVVDRVRSEPGVSLTALIDGGTTEGELHVLIAAGVIYVDLERDDLTLPRAVPAYPNRAMAKALATRHVPSFAVGGARPRPALSLRTGSRFSLVGAPLEVIAAGPEDVIVRDLGAGADFTTTVRRSLLEAGWADGSVVMEAGTEEAAADRVGARIARARYEATGQDGLDDAVRRYDLLNIWRATGQIPAGASKRTIRRWEAERKSMEALTGDPFVGLCPLPPSGNTSARLDPLVDAIIAAVIAEVYLMANGTSVANVVAEVNRRCGDVLPAPHERTVVRRIQAIPEEVVVAAREGRKAAYVHRQWAPIDPDAAAPNGDFPFAKAHIDGTLLDLETVHPATGLGLGRAWLHRMVDGRTGQELARYIGYVEPSEAVVLELLWRCVARWGVLPLGLVVDLGSEHRGGALHLFCLAYGVEIDWRPKSRPRHGAPVERGFLALDLDLLYTLEGNTQTRKNVRQQTKEVDPSRAAVHDIAWLDGVMEEYNAIAGRRIAEHLGQSRRDALVAGLAARGGSTIPYVTVDDRLRFLTMAPVAGTTRIVDPVKGFTVSRQTYHDPAFANSSIAGQPRPVRAALGDPSFVLVDVGGSYLRVACRSLARARVTSTEELSHLAAISTQTRTVAAAVNKEVKVELAGLAARNRSTAAERTRLHDEVNRSTQDAHAAAGTWGSERADEPHVLNLPVDDDPYAYAWEEPA